MFSGIISSSRFHCLLTQFSWKMALCLGLEKIEGEGVLDLPCHQENITNVKAALPDTVT